MERLTEIYLSRQTLFIYLFFKFQITQIFYEVTYVNYGSYFFIVNFSKWSSQIHYYCF